jgi:hypothetical protein
MPEMSPVFINSPFNWQRTFGTSYYDVNFVRKLDRTYTKACTIFEARFKWPDLQFFISLLPDTTVLIFHYKLTPEVIEWRLKSLEFRIKNQPSAKFSDGHSNLHWTINPTAIECCRVIESNDANVYNVRLMRKSFSIWWQPSKSIGLYIAVWARK